MFTAVIVILNLILVVTYGRILLYNTENNQTIGKFDCIYFIYGGGEEIPYCRRLNGTEQLDRNRSECENHGVKILFDDLLKQDVKPGNVLSWSSSVELADMYAGFFYNRSSIEVDTDQFICNCTMSGTFGKYCEYQLTHEAESFSEAIDAQFIQKQDDDPWNSQRYGSVLCYETLSCNTGDLCLDWREVCDGNQRCSSGIDEENCDKLEFNECEADEFRCTNGMCIAQEFWLDGDYDCMDWSDEIFHEKGETCPFYASSFECDEHLCPPTMYSCGDGQCIVWSDRMVFQRFYPILDGCFSKRNLNYMCEASPNRPSWTLQSGLCWPDRGYDDPRYLPWNMLNSSQLVGDETCQYLVRCTLSDGFERDCPCSSHNCTPLMLKICPKAAQRVLYPPKGLIDGNVLFFHNFRRSRGTLNSEPHVDLYGKIKCRGYHLTTNNTVPVPFIPDAILNSRFNNELCTGEHPLTGRLDPSSSFQFDEFCWNESRTFNGQPYAVKLDTCPYARECISQYRIHDGFSDCLLNEDEEMEFEDSYCTGNMGRSRFQCFNDQHRCLPLFFLGTGFSDCSNGYDEVWYGLDYLFLKHKGCHKSDTTDCKDWQEYIQQSSFENFSNSTSLNTTQPDTPGDQIPFRSYCDSFWDLEDHIDELNSSCQYWICQNHQYQCQTGQCIELDWVCDGEWDCEDASDEEAVVLIQRWSIHNGRLSGLNDRIKQCRERYSQSPFSNICNTSFEFGCYQAQVSNPLDIRLNRPCINLTQIGDGVENCYNAYDEKNTLSVKPNKMSMWGFHFRCENYTTDYSGVCNSNMRNNCTEILCPNHRHKVGGCSGQKDVRCLGSFGCKENVRCDGKRDCKDGEDEYWCAPGSINDQVFYRRGKTKIMRDNNILFTFDSKFPIAPIISSDDEEVRRNLTDDTRNPFQTMHSYQCNRGVAILEMNETRCLCPPPYYGHWCEFFSDRISIIANVDQETFPKTLANSTLKLRATLFFNSATIDSHEFNVVPSIERIQNIKHNFYLLYSRSDYLLVHKRWRYFNGTDVMNNHPYSVHVDVFSLVMNEVSTEIGSWHYPVYFDYLPAFRLAIVLKFPPWFGNETRNPCQHCNCSENATCQPVFNRNHSHYCSCKSGFHGKDCALYDPICENYCSINALCRRDDYDLIQISKISRYCICPLGHFGPRCHLKHDDCDSSPCLNSGTCRLTIDRSREGSYMCTCSQRFSGNRCEQEKPSVRVALKMTNTSFVRGTVVQLYHIERPLTLIIQYAKVYHGVPSTVNYQHTDENAPYLGVVKIYEDLAHPKYFIMYVLHQSAINITSSPKYCPHASLSLSKFSNSSIPIVFRYHHICRNDNQSFCFYDENYLCLCDSDNYRADCFIHNPQLDHCDNCLSRGQCLRGDQKDSNDFVCLCPPCHQGRRCEFNLNPFGFTLDSLLVGCSKEVKIIYTVLAFMVFALGLFNNYCSFITFKQPAPRKFAVGNYLGIITCINQVALLCLFLKFLQITLGIYYLASCKVISFFFSVFTRSTYWLTSWVTVERLLIILFPTSVLLKNPRRAIGISIVTSIVLLGMHVHEIIYYTVIEHLPAGSSICVTNFDSSLVAIYNQFSTLVHYLLPFVIQTISITFLIVLAAQSRVKTAGKESTFGQVLKKQFQTQKELYITPTIIVLSALPQTVLTFSLACTQLTGWQQHTLLGAYILSYAPQVLGFILYVLPSTSYKKEFGETLFGKTLFKWMS